MDVRPDFCGSNSLGRKLFELHKFPLLDLRPRSGDPLQKPRIMLQLVVEPILLLFNGGGLPAPLNKYSFLPRLFEFHNSLSQGLFKTEQPYSSGMAADRNVRAV